MEYSRITDDLLIGDTPGPQDYDLLRDLGVRLVINMRFEQRPAPDPGRPPLALLWLRTFDTPLLPIPIRTLQAGARAALETIHAGGKVYTHCAKGRHRGVAMGAAILIAQGQSPEDAMRLIQARRPLADPGAFHIRRRILRFARRLQTAHTEGPGS
jgi:protein tyrosine phosphatase (PTP) superfamily phosphohydrolase (DUF442 family)